MTKSRKIGFWLLASPIIIAICSLAVYAVSRSVINGFFTTHPTSTIDEHGNPAVIDYYLPDSVEHALFVRMVAVDALLVDVAWSFFALWFGIYFLLKTDS